MTQGIKGPQKELIRWSQEESETLARSAIRCGWEEKPDQGTRRFLHYRHRKTPAWRPRCQNRMRPQGRTSTWRRRRRRRDWWWNTWLGKKTAAGCARQGRTIPRRKFPRASGLPKRRPQARMCTAGKWQREESGGIRPEIVVDQPWRGTSRPDSSTAADGNPSPENEGESGENAVNIKREERSSKTHKERLAKLFYHDNAPNSSPKYLVVSNSSWWTGSNSQVLNFVDPFIYPENGG